MTPEAAEACANLVNAGIPVSCQTVLLAGVNDSAAALLDLFRALQRIRVRPYYVFQCDPVAGISHFRVPLERAVEIARACADRIARRRDRARLRRPHRRTRPAALRRRHPRQHAENAH